MHLMCLYILPLNHEVVNISALLLGGKKKMIPLHAMEALEVRGGIAPTDS
jgi:hypothetical protein